MLAVGLIIQTHADTAITINQMLVKPNIKIKSLLARVRSVEWLRNFFQENFIRSPWRVE